MRLYRPRAEGSLGKGKMHVCKTTAFVFFSAIPQTVWRPHLRPGKGVFCVLKSFIGAIKCPSATNRCRNPGWQHGGSGAAHRLLFGLSQVCLVPGWRVPVPVPRRLSPARAQFLLFVSERPWHPERHTRRAPMFTSVSRVPSVNITAARRRRASGEVAAPRLVAPRVPTMPHLTTHLSLVAPLGVTGPPSSEPLGVLTRHGAPQRLRTRGRHRHEGGAATAP